MEQFKNEMNDLGGTTILGPPPPEEVYCFGAITCSSLASRILFYELHGSSCKPAHGQLVSMGEKSVGCDCNSATASLSKETIHRAKSTVDPQKNRIPLAWTFPLHRGILNPEKGISCVVPVESSNLQAKGDGKGANSNPRSFQIHHFPRETSY